MELKFDASIADDLLGEGDGSTTPGDSPIRFDSETPPDTSLSALLDEIDKEPVSGEPEPQIDEALKKFMAKYGNDPAKIAAAALESQKRMNKVARERTQYERELREREEKIRELRSLTVQPPQGRQANPSQDLPEWDEVYPDPNKFFPIIDRRIEEVTHAVLQNARQQEQQRQALQELKTADIEFEDNHPELSIEEVEKVKRYAERRGVRYLEDAYRSILSIQQQTGGKNSGKDNRRAEIARLTRPRTLRSSGVGGMGSGGSTNLEEELQKVANGSMEEYAKLSPTVQKRIQYMLARGGLPEE